MKTARSRTPQSANRDGLILFAHGSRNAQWRKPFDRLLKGVTKQSGAPTVLAFNEFMSPTLAQAAQQLAAKGVKRATIVPLFLGGGAHVRGDTPRLAREAQAASGVKLKIAKAIGDNAEVLAAMARYCVAQAHRPKKNIE
ncbi:MAG: cobalamin biosynthesis protein CbiX [Betaproteobacteria bacterium]|nr:cobalamin biosynthesis protein CbiX [Betaproteobacteria bacterium]